MPANLTIRNAVKLDGTIIRDDNVLHYRPNRDCKHKTVYLKILHDATQPDNKNPGGLIMLVNIQA